MNPRIATLVLISAGLAAAAPAVVLEDDPAALITRLGAPRFDDRQQAEARLEALGRRALPALHQAVRDSRDVEVRNRAIALARTIEHNLLLQPTPVALAAGEHRVGAILREWSNQAGAPILLDPALPAPLRERALRWSEDRSLPIWGALAEVETRLGLRADLGPVSTPQGTALGFVLTAADGESVPTFDHGPFRLRLVRCLLRRERVLDPRTPRPQGVPTESLTAHVQINAEPHLILGHAGIGQVDEAVDDQGRSLLLDADGAGRPVTTMPLDIDSVEFTDGSQVMVMLSLKHPGDRLGGTIRRLRGTVPLAVAARRFEAIEVPIEGAQGQAFHGPDLTLHVDVVRPLPGSKRTWVELRLVPRAERGGEPPDPLLLSAPVILQNQLDVFDADGRHLNPLLVGSEQVDGELRLRLTLAPIEGAGAAQRLVYHGLTRAVVAVPFTFVEVPLP